MRTTLLIFGFIGLIFMNSFGQKNTPKDLKQTIKFLDKDCSDSLKIIIRTTDNKDLKKLSYPWGNSQYKTIYNWLDNEHSRIYKYLISKGINNFQVEVILENYKKHLLNEPINENSIVKPYLEIERKWKIEDENRATSYRHCKTGRKMGNRMTRNEAYMPTGGLGASQIYFIAIFKYITLTLVPPLQQLKPYLFQFLN